MSSCSAPAKRRFVAPHDVACSTLIAAITTGYDATAAAVAAHSGSSRSIRAGGRRFGSGPDRPGPALHAAMLASEASSRSPGRQKMRSEEHTPELQSLIPNTYVVFCFEKK